MPKDTKKPSSRPSPYPTKPEKINMVNSSVDEKHWEQIICPICLDPPHNPILLLCSSFEKGCRPYICHTNPLLSNCLGQFRKSSSTKGYKCPLCRGVIEGEAAVSSEAIWFMNSKPRGCSRENCEIRGTYEELMEHVEKDHVDDVADDVVDDVASSNEMRPVRNGRRRARMRVGYYPRHQLARRTIFT